MFKTKKSEYIKLKEPYREKRSIFKLTGSGSGQIRSRIFFI